MIKEVVKYQTSDGNLHKTKEKAEIHQQILDNQEKTKKKLTYIREQLRRSVYGHLFESDSSMIYSWETRGKISVIEQCLLQNTDLIQEIINNLKQIK